MFERRLVIIYLVLFLLLAALAARAVQVQVTQHVDWQKEAEKRSQSMQLLETTRGRIVDVKGRELAVNAACIDACVDYRAILPLADTISREASRAKDSPKWVKEQEKWISQQAVARLNSRLGDAYRQAEPAQKRQMRQDQVVQIRKDIAEMWQRLAAAAAAPDQVEETRQAIVTRIEMRRRYLWYTNYAAAARDHQAREAARQGGPQAKETPGQAGDTPSWYTRILGGEPAPELDDFDIEVEEQYQPHVILSAISRELANELGKNLDKYPGLVLRQSQHRVYPYGAAASHVIGYLGRVSREEMDKNSGLKNPLTGYWFHDLSGRAGMEAAGEETLRGRRGEVLRQRGVVVRQQEALPGDDLRLSLDIELQRRTEELFAHPLRADGSKDPDPLHGAAVLIDVPTGQIRALASFPTYDLNDLQYARLAQDEINRPLFNRATQAQFPPGSTVKPVVALAALSEGVLRPAETLDCTGYLVLRGKRYQDGKCHGGHAHGSIGVVDALAQSCNVFHETLADRLGMQRLSDWMHRFGMGEPAMIGLPEPVSFIQGERRVGRIPSDFEGPAHLRAVTTWFGGIGQGSVLATPLQMAQVAANLAREGSVVQPTLMLSATEPARPRLALPPAAIALVKEGMLQVVESPRGTARSLRVPGVRVAGKTGTAQAPAFSVPQRDERGALVRKDGRVQRVFLEPSTLEKPNPQAPWYRADGKSDDLSHAWFIGYAPADRPLLAFAVLVEYGGSGGAVAGNLARNILEAAVEEGYLPLSEPPL